MGLWMGYVFVSAVEAIFCLGFCICICIIGSICISPHTRTYQFNIHGASVWQVAGAFFYSPLSLPLSRSLSTSNSLSALHCCESINSNCGQEKHEICANFYCTFPAAIARLTLGGCTSVCVCVCRYLCASVCVCNLGEFICHIPTI